MTDAGLTALAAGRLPMLAILELSGCGAVTAVGISQLLQFAPLVRPRCPAVLSSLCVVGGPLVALLLCRSCSDAFLSRVVCVLQVRQLVLSNCPGAGPAAIAAISQHGGRLESLDVSSNAWVRGGALQQLAAACPRLREIDVRGCSHVRPHAPQPPASPAVTNALAAGAVATAQRAPQTPAAVRGVSAPRGRAVAGAFRV